MLNTKTTIQIQKTAQAFWNKEIKSSFFRRMARGKEIGHRIADFIDDKTTGLLAVKFTAKFQRNNHGTKLLRSMGDIWILQGKIYHPVNIKSGVSGNNGQPNMVSMKKLLNALLFDLIDSYYLLMVKVDNTKRNISCKVHFVDMLDYLDYVTFDSGPGQVMLKAKLFFDARDSGVAPPKRSLREKIATLVNLLEKQEKRLATNRRTKLRKIRMGVRRYAESRHNVTPKTQAPLHLQ